MNYQPSDYLPIIVQIGAALAFIVLTMVATHWLGPKDIVKPKMMFLNVVSSQLETLVRQFL
jgi:hypothetical protein